MQWHSVLEQVYFGLSPGFCNTLPSTTQHSRGPESPGQTLKGLRVHNFKGNLFRFIPDLQLSSLSRQSSFYKSLESQFKWWNYTHDSEILETIFETLPQKNDISWILNDLKIVSQKITPALSQGTRTITHRRPCRPRVAKEVA